MKNPWVIVALIAVIVVGGSVWYSQKVATGYNEGIVIKPNIKGNPDAPVTLVEYSDFQCPACASFQPVLQDVLAQYGDSIRFEYKHFPLIQMHPRAEAAARAAEAAGQQGKFFEFHDVLFAKQTEWVNAANPILNFAQYAKEIGLDVDQFTTQQRASLLADRVKAEFAEARELGLTGTPTFYLNGQRMEISTYEDFRTQIAAAVNPMIDFGLAEGESAATTSQTTPQ